MSDRAVTGSDPVKSLFFTCGHVVSRDAVVIPAQYNAFPNADRSRVALKFGETWAYHDVDNDVIGAVSFTRHDGSLWLLGRNGTVRTVGGAGQAFTLANIRGKFREERIANGLFGELLSIRAIGDKPVVCGQSLQIYVRDADGWQRFDHGLRRMAAGDLESIDGFALDDMYAVGVAGLMFHFDGGSWRQLDSPTNRPLSAVRCAPDGNVYVCGNDGTVLRGDKDGWDLLGGGQLSHHFWDLEYFAGKVYLAHAAGVVVYDGTAFADVDFGLTPKPSCHRLHSNDDQLWSFGVDDLLVFEGGRWTRVICPENR